MSRACSFEVYRQQVNGTKRKIRTEIHKDQVRIILF